jgi:hypothetical protein
MEEGVLRQLARFPPRDNRLPDLRALARLSRSIMGIEGRLRHPENLYVVVRLLHRFHQSHPVTIVVASDVDSEGGSGRSTLVEVRRRVVPISTSLRPQDYWRLVVLESGSALAVFRVGLNKLTSLVRHFFGVRSSALSFPLTNAGRARSYHLEFKGPADTYMARQGFEDLRGSPLGILGVPQESALSPARGQRHSHLYIRDGDPWLSRRVRYRVSYFERTPGSMAIAFAAAASALLISIVISWNQALLVKETDASGLLQLLFAFPVATAAAGVVLQSRARWGGVLSARIANMVTFAATLGALWVSSLPSTFDALPKVWFAIIGVLAFVAAACLGSWIVRLFVHAKFLDAGEGE